MSEPAVDDRAARRAIARDLDRTYLVEAGAGTGKTTALVERIVELVMSGRAELEEIAAITFTEAAAAELRDRVVERLELVAAGGPEPADRGPVDPGPASADRRRRAADALLQTEGAAISTLHGFARRILVEHPLEAGLPPVVEVLDEVRAQMAFAERWRAFADQLVTDDASAPALAASLLCGVSLEQWREVARAFDRDWDLVAEHEMLARAVPDPDTTVLRRSLAAALDLASACRDPGDRLARHLAGLRPFAERLERAEDPLDVLALLVQAPRLSADRLGRQAHWAGQVDQVRARLAEAADARQAALDAVLQPAMAQLVVALRAFTLRSAEARRLEGRLQYHDLLVRARDLVAGHPGVREALARRYRFVLVDEFQDTDPIQAELTVRLASDDPDPSGKDWRSLAVAAGRLFYVGDPKQSIYRFRRADIATFLSAKEAGLAQPLRLAANRRSVPGVVAWVNAVFGALMGDGEPAMQPAYEALVAQRAAVDSSAPVVLLGGPGQAGERTESVRRREAEAVAAALDRARVEGWTIGDEGRAVRFSDMAVLVPSRRGLPALQEALERAGVPYHLETTSLVYATAEVRDLLSVLRAIDDPSDEVSIVAALRSPLFGCGDDDLLAFHLAGGRWDYRRPVPDGLAEDHPAALGQATLARFHGRRMWTEVSGLVDAVLADRKVFELALDEPRPRESWRRLRFVADQARRFCDRVGGNLTEYLEWTARQSADDARVADALLSEPDHEAVRIMTIHGAKGLEFPLVVVCGLHQPAPPRRRPRVLWGDRGPEVAFAGTARTAGFDALERRETEMERHERLRLCYVAVTRARDHLVVSLHHRAGQTDCLAAALAEVSRGHPGLGRALEPSPGRPPLTRTRPSGPVLDHSLAARRRWVAQREASLATAAVPRALAATSLASLADPANRPEPDAEPWRRGRAGTAVGRAVHAGLQVVDLAGGPGVAPLARAAAVAEGIGRRATEVERLMTAALASPPLIAARQRGRCWRELYVGVPMEGRVLEGFVDLVVEGPDGLEVVDYKTDRVDPTVWSGPTGRRHRLQAAAYALAVERALRRPVSRCTLLYLTPQGARPLVVDDLEDLKTQVLTLLATRPPTGLSGALQGIDRNCS